MNDVFQAGVQYDDFKGSVAADMSDNISIVRFLQEQNLAGKRDIVAAVRIASGENSGSEVAEVSLVAYLYEGTQFDETPARLRAVECIVPVGKLFSLFKRFDLVMARAGSDLGNTKVDGPHY